MRFQLTDSKYHFAISQVFSPSLLSKINDPLHELFIQEFLYQCNLYPKEKPWSLIQGLEIAYNYLKKNYRCEYVYKNEIANQLLLRYHDDNSATLLKEVTSIQSIADIVIVNGNTVAYEIKTELDNFERLDSQLESYKVLYDFVYIVTHPGAINLIKTRVNQNIGIIILDSEDNLIVEREATSNINEFDSSKAIFTLRHSELLAAYKKYIGEVPVMGTATKHQFCYNWFLQLEKSEAHCIFNEALKSRKPSSHQFKLVKDSPNSLKMMFLGRALTKKYCIETMDKIGIFDI